MWRSTGERCYWGLCHLEAISTQFDKEPTWLRKALRIAIAKRRAGAGVIHHSGQTVQYASGECVEEIKNHGLEISMAWVVNPYEKP